MAITEDTDLVDREERQAQSLNNIARNDWNILGGATQMTHGGDNKFFILRSFNCLWQELPLLNDEYIEEAYITLTATTAKSEPFIADIAMFSNLELLPQPPPFPPAGGSAWTFTFLPGTGKPTRWLPVATAFNLFLELLDSGSASLVDITGTTNATLFLKSRKNVIAGVTLGPDQVGQAFELTVEPNSTIATAVIKLIRSGTITGTDEMTLSLYSRDTADIESLPGDVLAVSDVVAPSSVGTTDSDITFTFSGGESFLTMDAGLRRWMVLDTAYDRTGGHIRWKASTGQYQFFSDDKEGYSSILARGNDLFISNYILSNQLPYYDPDSTNAGSIAPHGSIINWDVPAVSIGDQVTTPNLATLVQEYIRSGSYNEGDFLTHLALAFGFGYGNALGADNVQRNWAASNHATLQAPLLTLKFRKRNVVVI